MKKLLLILMLLITANVYASESSIIISADKDTVLDLVKKAILADNSDATINRNNNGVGYIAQYHTFFKGDITITSFLIPMAKGDDIKATAYKVEFQSLVSKGGTTAANNAIENVRDRMIKLAPNLAVTNEMKEYSRLDEQSNKCTTNLENDVQLQPLLKTKVSSTSDAVTILMMADETKPNKQEKEQIGLWAQKKEACLKGFYDIVPFYPNDPAISVVLDTIQSSNELLLKLYKGEITFGEYAKGRKEIGLRQTKQAQEVKDKMRNQQLQADANLKDNAFKEDLLNIERVKANALMIDAFKPPARVNQTQTINVNR